MLQGAGHWQPRHQVLGWLARGLSGGRQTNLVDRVAPDLKQVVQRPCNGVRVDLR